MNDHNSSQHKVVKSDKFTNKIDKNIDIDTRRLPVNTSRLRF